MTTTATNYLDLTHEAHHLLIDGARDVANRLDPQVIADIRRGHTERYPDCDYEQQPESEGEGVKQ